MNRKTTRRRVVRGSLLTGNVVLLFAIVFFVVQNPRASETSVRVSALSAASAASSPSNPLDQVSSADIAVTVARLGNMSEATAINQQAISQAAQVALAPTNSTVVAKPQVITTLLKSRKDIKTYTTQAGDTIASIAAKFGVTSDSIKWSNNLSGPSVAVNQKLVIPPVNGIVYTVKAGDTVDSLAAKYKADKNLIISYNDTEIAGLPVGQQILIPNATQAAPAATYSARATSFPWGSSPIYGSNGYDYGYCTWYVASRISVPSNWGNANTWAYYGSASGWTVSTNPRAGAIGQTSAGYEGHVAIVEAVSADGKMIKYSDMNGLAGWGRVGYSDWVPASHFQHYIYR